MNISLFQRLIEPRLIQWQNSKITSSNILAKEELTKKIWNSPHFNTHQPPLTIGDKEKKLIQMIKMETKHNNINNLTRTKSYLDIFSRNPELDWAFLAHMVSRNGGYYMTDLKSSMMPSLFSLEDREAYFVFLEKSNAFIFQDAFPQLRLYEESKRLKTSLFHLLNVFHVSIFMRPFWEVFFQSRNSKLITVALIVNEQNMLEKRVIKRIQRAQTIIDSLPFKLQQYMGLTNILFPYRKSKRLHHRLSGLTIRHFESVADRILTGKKLYQILFSRTGYSYTLNYAKRHPHTGSRSDYWPHAYTFKHSLDRDKINSPTIKEAWGNYVHFFTERTDWFTDLTPSIQSYFDQLPSVENYDMTLPTLKNLILFQSINNIQK